MTLQHRLLSTDIHRRSKCPPCATACRDCPGRYPTARACAARYVGRGRRDSGRPAPAPRTRHRRSPNSCPQRDWRPDDRTHPGPSGSPLPTDHVGRQQSWLSCPFWTNVASARVAATGTRRHLEALMFAGWPVSQLHTCPELVWMDRFLAAGRLAAATARPVRGNSNTMGTIPSRGFARQRTRQDLDLRVPTGDLL